MQKRPKLQPHVCDLEMSRAALQQLSCTTITTWNFKEGEKLLWFFGQQKKAELALAGRAKKHEHGNHPTKVQSQQRHYNEVDSTISLDSTLKTVDQWSKLSNQGVPNGIMAEAGALALSLFMS